jgi:N-acyl-D-amino-acid deacylase
VPIQIAHLQMNGPHNAGRAAELLTKLEEARAAGIDVTCDTYPYTAGSTFIQSLLPAWAIDGGPDAILRRLSEPETRARITADLSAQRVDWSRYNLVGAESPTNHPFEGNSFPEVAQARGLSVAEFVCAVLGEEELRACFVHHAAHEGNVREILRWSSQMVGSDGLHLPGKTHPRLYGTFPRVLGRYVREEKILSLEQAIHKMTGMPAARLGLKQRGLLQTGYAADIVLFDPATVCDTATFDDPLRYPTGIPYVFVNGVCVKEADQATGALPGQVLRRV